MSLTVSSLNSGSNGNCYYIGNENEAVLIDGGLSCRETERRLKRLGLSMKNVKALFVTHEHADHIYGVASLSKKHKLPIYVTPNTMVNGRLHLKQDLTFSFNAYEPVVIGNLHVTAFPKYHDAIDPHSFIVSGNGVHVGVLTDIGMACQHVKRNFELCHAAFLEANYDEMMLEHGDYPPHLKNRIRSDNGHLSNLQALQLFQKHRSPFLSHLFLSHLSENNNSPEIVARLFTKVAGQTEIIIATRHEETALYTIHGNPGVESPFVQTNIKKAEQLSLF
ncbi:MAG TPA: MBL fold metallo-hydrolase [Cyclobacteriaceae bacterium]|jgi:phosphoribosyl 1,2-cyclic phosphodiesterase|nr:MBL fold metallo-hydrolase [Cyclobacteriaceae bacterium]